jgi:APA family basic amino acid/polyamine antiporter
MKTLRRELGVFGATMMGLGSIVGTGVFVSIGIAAGVAGPAVILAIVLAAGLATCNALSSAQLAAAHPVSGGTYEYGYKYLRPWLGFTAGWTFLCAKTASAATAALGFSGYLLSMQGSSQGHSNFVAVSAVAVLTLVVLSGIRQSNQTNIIVVSITLFSLGCFVAAGLPMAAAAGTSNLTPFFTGSWSSVLHAAALMFVAYAGYARIATLGEEVHEPHRTIPRAIVASLFLSALLYVAVAVVSIAAVGADALAAATGQRPAPLEVVARQFSLPAVSSVVAVGAMTAMLGVLLNLILGLSRMLLAMARRGDMPAAVAALNESRTTPYVAVLLVGATVAALALLGSVKTTWSFSAFTVLIYYAITNLSALRLTADERLYSPAYSWTGLAGCVFLSFWIDWQIWASGFALILFGLLWYWGRSSQRTKTGDHPQIE